jgi:succinate dehydrogenase hydrophobic anchor subunit
MLNLKRTLSAWALIIMAESISGAFRQLVLAPRIGELAAHQTGVVFGCAIIFVVAWFFFARANEVSQGSCFFSGFIWVVLTVVFEIALGVSMGYSVWRILADYDLPKGGLMGIGLMFMLFAPLVATQLWRVLHRERDGFDRH